MLLKRVRKIQQPTEEKMEPSQALTFLRERLDTRRWKEQKERELMDTVTRLWVELVSLRHYRHCDYCLTLLCLDVERYLGNHSPWYLNLINEDACMQCPICGAELQDSKCVECDFVDDSIWATAPHARNFEIGNYWKRTEGRAIPFILARLAWAEPIIKQEYVEAVTLLRSLRRERNFKRDLPYLRVILNSVFLG